MLNNLIIFEDSAGMCSIYSKMNRNTDIEVINGVGISTALSPTNSLIREMNRHDNVFLVFDFDNTSDPSSILSLTQFSKINEYLCNITASVKFLPIKYSAESIALWQFVTGVNGLTPSQLFHMESTTKLPLAIIRLLTGRSNRSVKAFYSWIDTSLIKENIKMFGTNLSKGEQWILDDCSLTSQAFMSYDDTCDYIERVNNEFSQEQNLLEYTDHIKFLSTEKVFMPKHRFVSKVEQAMSSPSDYKVISGINSLTFVTPQRSSDTGLPTIDTFKEG